ncbi:hypothetical protein EWM64_g5358 [Hericium alpestre]|uniref:CCHC-type domain-containing protein n=1 Tax=Hericium alpestre TaxID=135208 RepID=A0A4Y9ZYS9_9AGAM|nr:hypothetical protein EWM64_g5358 [Hericium alpestre]
MTARQASVSAPVSIAKKPRVINEADEVEMTSFDHPVEIVVEIETLWEEGIYIPMHLFTRNNLRTISEQRGSLLKKFTFNKDGLKASTLGLLDVEHALLGKETDLTLILWIEELSRPVYNSCNCVASSLHAPAGNSSRFTPYDCDRSQPFPTGKPHTLAVGACIACGKPGHYALACVHPTNPKYLADIRDNKLSFCVAFNTHSPNACKPRTHGMNIKHACSICGNEQHHAAACSAGSN